MDDLGTVLLIAGARNATLMLEAARARDKRVAEEKAMQGETTIMGRLHTLTYALQHDPNSQIPFVVRLCGRFSTLDYRPLTETWDILGNGKTFDEAATNALCERKRRYPNGR